MVGYEKAYGDALDAVLTDQNIDAVVVIMMLTTETGLPSTKFIVDLKNKFSKKTIYVTYMGDHRHNVDAKKFLEPRGVPCYMLVEEPFEVLALLAECREKMSAR